MKIAVEWQTTVVETHFDTVELPDHIAAHVTAQMASGASLTDALRDAEDAFVDEWGSIETELLPDIETDENQTYVSVTERDVESVSLA